MNKHTPSHWIIDIEDNQYAPDSAIDIKLGIDPNEFQFNNNYCRIIGDNATKNAQLIAAAPELLQALKYIKENCFVTGIDAIEIMNTAINKAEGK